MNPVSATPAHILLHKKEQSDNHSTKKDDSGAASAFASYGFGPMSEGGKDKSSKPASGVGIGQNPLNAHSLSWVTSVQEVGTGSAGKQVA
jgi:hypothetical protein